MNSMAMPCWSHAAMLSLSFTEPPGWMIAVTPGRGGRVDVVREREERVRRQHAPLRPVAGLLHRDLDRHDAATSARPRRRRRACRVASTMALTLHVLADEPGEVQGVELGLGRLALRDHFHSSGLSAPTSRVCTSSPPSTRR